MNLAEYINALRMYGLEYFKKYYSIYEGIVEDNEDPKKLGRLKVSVPKVYGKYISGWAAGKGLMLGRDAGVMVLPSKGEAVWVSFEGGDPRYPVWEYGWGFKGSTDSAKLTYNTGVTLFAGESIIKILKNGEVSVKVEDCEVNVASSKIKLISGAIDLGDSPTEAALLGTSTVALLNKLITACAAITTPVLGVPTPIVNIPSFTVLLAELETLKSTITKVK
jgi:hypothetical protein